MKIGRKTPIRAYRSSLIWPRLLSSALLIHRPKLPGAFQYRVRDIGLSEVGLLDKIKSNFDLERTKLSFPCPINLINFWSINRGLNWSYSIYTFRKQVRVLERREKKRKKRIKEKRKQDHWSSACGIHHSDPY